LCHNSKPMKHKASLLPPAAVRTLVRHFRAQRPLRGGSLLITIFGDAIAPRGGAVTLGSLIRLAAPFGLTERLVRTSAARLAADGWLAARRSGRRSEYRLTRGGAERFAEATRRIYAAQPRGWGGAWTLLLLPPLTQRPLALRRELRWLGFGQLTPVLFAHPACPPRRAARWLQDLPGGQGTLLLPVAGGAAGVDRPLAARGWNLELQARRYRGFIARFAPVAAALAGRSVPPLTAFVVRTLLIHEYRKIHLLDPQLPQALLPDDWAGRAAYRLCRALYRRTFRPAEDHLSACARQLQRPLPHANGAAQARFRERA
jgi:phenylacetic acid degradation operon negative regulatory protein